MARLLGREGPHRPGRTTHHASGTLGPGLICVDCRAGKRSCCRSSALGGVRLTIVTASVRPDAHMHDDCSINCYQMADTCSPALTCIQFSPRRMELHQALQGAPPGGQVLLGYVDAKQRLRRRKSGGCEGQTAEPGEQGSGEEREKRTADSVSESGRRQCKSRNPESTLAAKIKDSVTYSVGVYGARKHTLTGWLSRSKQKGSNSTRPKPPLRVVRHR